MHGRSTGSSPVGSTTRWLHQQIHFQNHIKDLEEHMSLKAMVSQPMAGKSEEEILATRDKAVDALKADGYEVIDTYFGQ